MSSHPPTGKPKDSSEPDPACDLADAGAGVATLNRQPRFGSTPTSANVIEDAHKNWLLVRPITESASSTSALYCIAVTFLTLGLGRPRRVCRRCSE
jgi:hypothetical protein